MDDLLTLLAYQNWATARILTALAQLSPEEWGRDLHSSHGGVGGTLSHLYGAEVIWSARLKGEPAPTFAKVAFPDSLAELEVQWTALQQQRRDFVATSGPQAVIQYANLNGEAQRSTVGEIVRHVVNHATYHRGQLVTMLRQLGYSAPNTDLIAFYRLLAASK
ncbi:DinB family protein [Deinococcus sp.]|uniref:DinB family protein n=1 Tax=Deinococcus sp. TaxID=47478 RepID=UPI003CC6BB4C